MSLTVKNRKEKPRSDAERKNKKNTGKKHNGRTRKETELIVCAIMLITSRKTKILNNFYEEKAFYSNDTMWYFSGYAMIVITVE